MTKDLSSCKKWLWNYNNSWDTLTLSVLPYETLCAIQYHLFTLKHVRDTHGEVICLGKKQALVCNFTKSSTPLWLFLNCSIILKHSIIYARNRCENEKKKKWYLDYTGYWENSWFSQNFHLRTAFRNSF